MNRFCELPYTDSYCSWKLGENVQWHGERRWSLKIRGDVGAHHLREERMAECEEK